MVYSPLAIHRSVSGYGWCSYGWCISHIPTGRQIAPADTRREAEQLVIKLLTLDWIPETLDIRLSECAAKYGGV